MIRLPSEYSAAELASFLGAHWEGDEHVKVRAVGTLADSADHLLVFLSKGSLSHPVACVLAQKADPLAACSIVVSHPKDAMRRILEHFAPSCHRSHHRGIHPTAAIAEDVVLGEGVTIGPYAVVESGCVLEAGVVLGAHVHLMHDVRIGRQSWVDSGAVVYPYVKVGAHVQIGARSVIGDAGFGYDWDGQAWRFFPQEGAVRIEDHVDIGPLSVIDRGALSDTIIGRGVKLDALSMVGHGVTLGEHVVFAACVAIGGSTEIGAMTLGGGRVSIADHVRIAAGTRLAGGSNVPSSVKKAGEYASALPLMSAKQWRRWLRFLWRTIGIDSD